MSELIQKHDNSKAIHRRLLTGVSAFALMVTSSAVAGSGNDHPTVWIELGADFDAISGLGDRFTPPFTLLAPTPGPYLRESPIDAQKPSRFSSGGDGSIRIQPKDSDWVYSASIRYGRSNNNRKIHNQTAVPHVLYDPLYAKYPSVPRSFGKTSTNYAETTVHQSESHLILDFQAGKDVGLGMFGRDSHSSFSAGVRVARFNFHSDVTIKARPEVIPYTVNVFYGYIPYPAFKFNGYYMHSDVARSFSGIGPSLSLKSTVPLAGSAQSGELSLDWGLSGALLFGRQKANVHHHTTARYYHGKYQNFIPGYTGPNGYYSGHSTHYSQRYDHNVPVPARSRSVIVPNLGTNIGLSYRIEAAKFSIGYHTDFFFGAMDGGIDAAKKKTMGFNGLYASLSIGLGD